MLFHPAPREHVELIDQLSKQHYIADPDVRERLSTLVRAHLAGAHRFSTQEADATIAWLMRRPMLPSTRVVVLYWEAS